MEQILTLHKSIHCGMHDKKHPCFVMYQFSNLYENNGVMFIRNSSLGASFFLLFDSVGIQARFKDENFFMTDRNVVLRPGFEMKVMSTFYLPPPKKDIPRHEHALPKQFGQHYVLTPLQDMPLVDYMHEVKRLQIDVSPSAITTDMKEYDVLEPSDGLMVLVAMAFKQHIETDFIAWLCYNSICAVDMTFEQLCQQPDIARWALVAIENFFPPDDDPIAASDCWHIEKELHRILDFRPGNQGCTT